MAAPPEECCTECRGTGQVLVIFGYVGNGGYDGYVPCSACDGTGDRVVQVTNALQEMADPLRRPAVRAGHPAAQVIFKQETTYTDTPSPLVEELVPGG